MEKVPILKGNDMEISVPMTYLNWSRYRKKESHTRIIEAKIWTDSIVTGQPDIIGPIQIINTMASANPEYFPTKLRPSIATRVKIYCEDGDNSEFFKIKEIKTRDEHYHRGIFLDEIAALVSISLGIRAIAGSVDRDFFPHGDPLGTPTELHYNAHPTLPPTSGSPVVPRLSETHNISRLTALEKFPDLQPDDSVVVIKAARLYQQAMWLADAHPEFSWLLLVSAIETAANHWVKNEKSLHISLEESFPGIFSIIQKHKCDEIADLIRDELRDNTKSTQKYLSFMSTFAPTPPTKRPALFFQLDYSPENLRKSLEKVYRYRSRALHSGIPFPGPMCESARKSHEGEAYMETPQAVLSGAGGSSWAKKDLPMALHTFEHISRGAILNWMESLSA